MNIAIVCIVKNECDYILEWLAYYRAVLGINNFIIADNVSDDGTSQLLEALDQSKIIKRIHFPRIEMERGIQADAYNYILKEYGSQYDYMAFVDADEFIVNNTGVNFNRLLKNIAGKGDAGAIALNWRNFGSSGNYYQTQQLVIERFVWASRPEHKYNHHIKSIIKPSAIREMFIHHAHLKKGKYYYDLDGKTLFVDSITDQQELGEGHVSPFSKAIKNHDLYVAHYVVKSKDEHMTKKAKRGSAAGKASRQKGVGYFKGHDLNQLECHDLYKHVDAVAAEVHDINTVLKNKSLFYSRLITHIDKFDDILVGWVGVKKNEDIVIKVLVDGINEYEHKLSISRPDVVEAGISSIDNCGFSLNLSSYNKSVLKVWIKGSNVVLWDGSKGY
jgi:hypothetical protein